MHDDSNLGANGEKQHTRADSHAVPILIRNGMLLTMEPEHAPGSAGIRRGEDVLLESGKIKQIGPNLNTPQGARIIDATDKIVMPGMIDAHTHLGIAEEGIGFEGSDFNEMTGPVTPEMRAIDAINPYEEGLKDAWRCGVTSVLAGPGSANVIGGQSAAMKTYGDVIDRMVIVEPAGVKVAFGENPKRVYSAKSKSPSTRMATAALLRKALLEAQDYKRKWDEYHEQVQKSSATQTDDHGSKGSDSEEGTAPEEKEGSSEQKEENSKSAQGTKPIPPDQDLQKDILVNVLNQVLPLRAHAHRADDIMTAVRIAREFDILLTIEHATEGHKVAEELKVDNIPAVVGPSLTSRLKVELRERTFETPRILFEHGVKFAITTDHPVIPIYTLPLCAGMAVREGLPWEAGLKAITRNAAEIAGISHRVGILKAGMDADVVIFGGDPLQVDAAPEHVFINGYEVIAPHNR